MTLSTAASIRAPRSSSSLPRIADREPDPQAGEALQGLVMEFARPAPALLLGRLDALAQPLLLDRLAGRDRGRGAGGEGSEQPLVLAVEAPFVSHAVVRGEDADRAAAECERHEQGGLGVVVEDSQRAGQRRPGVRDPLGTLRAQDPSRHRSVDRQALAVSAAV